MHILPFFDDNHTLFRNRAIFQLCSALTKDKLETNAYIFCQANRIEASDLEPVADGKDILHVEQGLGGVEDSHNPRDTHYRHQGTQHIYTLPTKYILKVKIQEHSTKVHYETLTSCRKLGLSLIQTISIFRYTF